DPPLFRERANPFALRLAFLLVIFAMDHPRIGVFALVISLRPGHTKSVTDGQHEPSFQLGRISRLPYVLVIDDHWPLYSIQATVTPPAVRQASISSVSLRRPGPARVLFRLRPFRSSTPARGTGAARSPRRPPPAAQNPV